MKKFTAILLTVIMVASLFISCNNSIAPTITDETVSVSFSEATSRSLTASLEDFEKGKYFWKYAAKKNTADGTGLNSGATESYEEAKAIWIKGGSNATAPTAPGLGSVAGFSQGIWDFKLFAYKLVGTNYNLAYQGEVTGVSLKKGSANTVSVTVSPVAGDKGTLVLDNSISLTPAKSTNKPTGLTKVYTVTKLGDTSAISPDNGTNTWTLDAGAYKVNVDFVKDGFTYASGSVVATVYSNIQTTVRGDLAELVTKAEFDSSINPDVMNKEASSGSVDLGTLTQTDVILKDATSVEASKVVAKVPKDAASQIINTVTGGATSAKNTIDLALRVDTVSATNTTLELEIGMQATVTQIDAANKVINQTTQKVTELKDSDQQPVISEVTIKLQPGLRNVVVKHNGITMTESATAGDQVYSYDATTGTLKIWTSSFSPFSITYQAPEYVAKIGDTKYTSLIAAVSAAKDNDTIVLLSDTAGGGIGLYNNPNEGQIKNKNLTIDFNGYTYDVSNSLQGSTGTVSQSFHLEKGKSITLKNGKLTSSISDARMLIQNYCDLTLDNMVLDATEGPNAISYVLSNNNGNVSIKDTKIIAKQGKVAFDACWAPKKGYPEGAQVTVNNSKIVGDIEFDLWGENVTTDCLTTLTINSGEFLGNIVVTDIDKPNIVINGGSFTDLASAIKYAADGASITLADDLIISSTLIINNSITIDGGNHSLQPSTSIDMIKVDGNNIEVTITNLNMYYTTNTGKDGIVCGADKSVINIENVNISSCFKALHFNDCRDTDVVINNSSLESIYPFNVNGGNIKSFSIENSVLNGWTSFSKPTNDMTYLFKNCEFGQGYGYATLKPYGNTTLDNCNFSKDYFEGLEGGIASGTETPIDVRFNSCTIDDEELTVELLHHMFNYDITSGSSSGDSTIEEQNWYINGSKIGFAATN